MFGEVSSGCALRNSSHKRSQVKNILNGLKCGLLAPIFALTTILIAVLQVILYPLYLLLTFLFFES